MDSHKIDQMLRNSWHFLSYRYYRGIVIIPLGKQRFSSCYMTICHKLEEITIYKCTSKRKSLIILRIVSFSKQINCFLKTSKISLIWQLTTKKSCKNVCHLLWKCVSINRVLTKDNLNYCWYKCDSDKIMIKLDIFLFSRT
jgi:hypothetical protein